MREFLKWLFGIVYVRIAEDKVERFLNLCKNRGLELYGLEHVGGEYRFAMSLPDYRKIRPIARKTGTLPFVWKRKGFPFVLGEWSRKKVFTGGFLLFVALTFFLTHMIWSIEIDGCSYHTEEALLEFLSEQGICCGMFYKDLDYKETEDQIRLAYQDISWVSVERVGTKLHIRIKESKLLDTAGTVKEPSHLIASEDGVVESIVTRSGTPQVKAGAEVKKGDILISGIVEVYGDFDEPVATHYVYADGDVKIRREKSYYSVRELEYERKVYTGQKKTSYGICGFGKQLNLPSWGTEKEQADVFTELLEYRLNPSFVMPFSLLKKEKRAYEIVRTRYTPEEAEALEAEKFDHYLAAYEKEKAEVIQKEIRIRTAGALCIAEGHVSMTVLEDGRRRISEEEQAAQEPEKTEENIPQ